ncbi:MAG: hypothetical protein FWE40_03265 [Oscillospiraceae bacterium]|nr:hypothetical protein [Oscillospiraceae bacterium]
MKLIAILLVLLVLAGCGSAATVVVNGDYDAETTTEVITTTEETTTTMRTSPPNAAGVRVEAIDLHAAANARLRTEIESMTVGRTQEVERRLTMSATHTVINRESEPNQRGDTINNIWLRNEITGEETMLMTGEFGDEYHEHMHTSPWAQQVIDERFFWQARQAHVFFAFESVFDLQRMMAIPLERMMEGFALERNGVHYFVSRACGYYCCGRQLHVHTVTLENLETVASIAVGKNLLADVPQAHLDDCFHQTAIAPNGRYLAAASGDNIYIFDLQAQAFVARVPAENLLQIQFRGNNTLVVYRTDWGVNDTRIARSEALRITLP